MKFDWLERVFLLVFFLCVCGFSGDVFAKSDELPVFFSSESIELNLDDLVQEVVRRNSSVIKDFIQTQISAEQVQFEKGIFDPNLEGRVGFRKIKTPNTTDEILTRQENDYFEDTSEAETSLSGLISSGAQWKLQYATHRTNSSTIETYRDIAHEYQNSLKAQLTQPLLKNFGPDVTRTRIELAKLEQDVDQYKFEQKIMELVGVTVQVYWKLYGTQEIYKSWERSLDVAEKTLEDFRDRSNMGKVPKTALLEARSAVNLRRAELYKAKRKIVEVQNQLMTLLNVSVHEAKTNEIIPVDDPLSPSFNLSEMEDSVRAALENWPEYKIAQIAVEKETKKVQHLKNQLLPQLDLSGSVSTTGLKSKYEDSFKKLGDDEYLSWTIGVEFSMPLGNTQAKSSFEIAHMKLVQAELELRALEKSFKNSIASKIDAVQSFKLQLEEFRRGLDLQQRLLELEKVKLKAGRIGLKDLFEKQEEFVDYQRKFLSSVVNYKVSQAILEIALGNILNTYHLDATSLKTLDGSNKLGEVLSLKSELPN